MKRNKIVLFAKRALFWMTGLSSCIRFFFLEHRKKKKSQSPIKVVFILQFQEMWNSFKSVFDNMKSDPFFSPIVLCVPKIKNVKNNTFFNENEAYEFCKSRNIDCIDVKISQERKTIKSLKPDYIVIMRSYYDCMPRQLSVINLQKISKIVYIPYNCRITQGAHMEMEFYNIFQKFSLFFADCDESANYVKSITSHARFAKYQKIYNYGSPRFDLPKSQILRKNIDCFLWLPRWSVDKRNGCNHFYDYLDFFFEYFDNHRNLQLIIRPHPLMFSTFVSSGYKTEEEIEQTMQRINTAANVSLDLNSDYLDSFEKSDAVLSDLSSLILEYFFTGKPIAIFDKIEDLTELGTKIEENSYFVGSREQLYAFLDLLTSENYSDSSLRHAVIEDYLNKYNNCGKKITEAIKKDYLDKYSIGGCF